MAIRKLKEVDWWEKTTIKKERKKRNVEVEKQVEKKGTFFWTITAIFTEKTVWWRFSFKNQNKEKIASWLDFSSATEKQIEDWVQEVIEKFEWQNVSTKTFIDTMKKKYNLILKEEEKRLEETRKQEEERKKSIQWTEIDMEILEDFTDYLSETRKKLIINKENFMWIVKEYIWLIDYKPLSKTKGYKKEAELIEFLKKAVVG